MLLAGVIAIVTMVQTHCTSHLCAKYESVLRYNKQLQRIYDESLVHLAMDPTITLKTTQMVDHLCILFANTIASYLSKCQHIKFLLKLKKDQWLHVFVNDSYIYNHCMRFCYGCTCIQIVLFQ